MPPKRAAVEVIEVDVKPGSSAGAATKRGRASAAAAPPPEPAFKASEIFADPRADFVIRTKDNVEIRIETYHLLSNSPFFQKLHAESRMTSPFNFPKDDSRVVEDVLCLMTRRTMDWKFKEYEEYSGRISQIKDLCHRLEADFLLERFSSMLSSAIGSRDHTQWVVFFCAVQLGDLEMSRRVLPLAAEKIWPYNPTGVNHDLELPVATRSTLDPAGMPKWMLEELPTDNLIALLRAYSLRTNRKPTANWQEVAEEYVRVMKLAEERRRTDQELTAIEAEAQSLLD